MNNEVIGNTTCPICKCIDGDIDCYVEVECEKCHRIICEGCYDQETHLCVDCGGKDGIYGSYT
jgi:hypothetical protein